MKSRRNYTNNDMERGDVSDKGATIGDGQDRDRMPAR